jgi:hypothetical protein
LAATSGSSRGTGSERASEVTELGSRPRDCGTEPEKGTSSTTNWSSIRPLSR